MMGLPVALQNKIINFLKSLPNINDIKGRQAFIYSAGLDSELQNQISFEEPPAKFVPLLASQLLKYGKLNDGRHAIEAVLETAKNSIGLDGRANCEALLQEISLTIEQQFQKNLRQDEISIKSNTQENIQSIKTTQRKIEDNALSLKETIKFGEDRNKKVQIFLSYVKEDQVTVEFLYKQLTEIGCQPWMASINLLGGQSWKETKLGSTGINVEFWCQSIQNYLTNEGFLDKMKKMIEMCIFLKKK